MFRSTATSSGKVGSFNKRSCQTAKRAAWDKRSSSISMALCFCPIRGPPPGKWWAFLPWSHAPNESPPNPESHFYASFLWSFWTTMSFISMGPGVGGRSVLPNRRLLHDFMICFKSFQANWRRAMWGRIFSMHSGVRLKIMNEVVNKRIICSDSDILVPNCFKNVLLSVSIRSHVVVSRNFLFPEFAQSLFMG